MDTCAPRWTVSVELGPGAFAPRTRAALARLGYDLRTTAAARQNAVADLLLLSESVWRTRSTQDGPPVIVVRSSGTTGEIVHPRVVASVNRPLRISNLYPLLQSALEEHPRRTPRVSTALPARCAGESHGFPGAVVSLSEGGCLFRSAAPLPDDAALRVLFPLPRTPLVSARVRVTERQGDAVALRFDDPTEPSRSAIARYVEEQLLAP